MIQKTIDCLNEPNEPHTRFQIFYKVEGCLLWCPKNRVSWSRFQQDECKYVTQKQELMGDKVLKGLGLRWLKVGRRIHFTCSQWQKWQTNVVTSIRAEGTARYRHWLYLVARQRVGHLKYIQIPDRPNQEKKSDSDTMTKGKKIWRNNIGGMNQVLIPWMVSLL